MGPSRQAGRGPWAGICRAGTGPPHAVACAPFGRTAKRLQAHGPIGDFPGREGGGSAVQEGGKEVGKRLLSAWGGRRRRGSAATRATTRNCYRGAAGHD